MPANMKAEAEAAKARHARRRMPPDVGVSKDANGHTEYLNPYSDADLDDWAALLFDAFGTRSVQVFDTFLHHLASLCPVEWNSASKTWRPDADTLRTAIALVQAAKPKNEIEAALAAQMVAIHFTTMKVGKELARSSYPEPRMAATLAALGRTYAQQLAALQSVKRRGKIRREMYIEVERHNHLHYHTEGGGPGSGGQPHGTEGMVGDRIVEGTVIAPKCPALPGPDEDGKVVPIRRSQGKEGVPNTRRRKSGGA